MSASLDSTSALLDEVDRLCAAGSALDAVDLLDEAVRATPTDELLQRLASVRYLAFAELSPASKFDTWPVDTGSERSTEPVVPRIAPEDLTGESLRSAVNGHGCAWVPGLFGSDQVASFTAGIDAALAAREAKRDGGDLSGWFSGLPLPRDEAISLGRPWIAGAGGMLGCDSPRNLEMILGEYEAVGLRQVITDYLGERPVLSANKCTLRLVPLTANTDWHQDGAFLGTTQGIRAINVWVALTDCGHDAPGIDLVPKRLDAVLETGTGGAIFDWAVGPQVVESVAADAPVQRPIFNAGDALIFDDVFLHRTAIDDQMVRPRYAIESWFFAPTSYPAGQVPLVW